MATQQGQALLKFAASNDKLLYLKSRWLDEREYEDFSEYEKIIRTIFTEAGYIVKKISKSFTCIIQKDNLEFKLKINAGSVSATSRVIV